MRELRRRLNKSLDPTKVTDVPVQGLIALSDVVRHLHVLVENTTQVSDRQGRMNYTAVDIKGEVLETFEVSC